jgi:hypothetical protein
MTSIEWLIQEVEPYGTGKFRDLFKEVIDKAKEMHKQEIIDAWNSGDYTYFYSKETGRDFADGKEYYQETFVSKGSDEAELPKHPSVISENGNELLFDKEGNLIKELPKQETLYTEEQVKEAYFKGATDVHDKCTDRTWRGVETKVDIELLKKLNAEYILSLKQPKKD